MPERRYKQVVIQHPNGFWACWFADIDESVHKAPTDADMVYAKSLYAVLRKANRALRPKDGKVFYTYMERFGQ